MAASPGAAPSAPVPGGDASAIVEPPVPLPPVPVPPVPLPPVPVPPAPLPPVPVPPAPLPPVPVPPIPVPPAPPLPDPVPESGEGVVPPPAPSEAPPPEEIPPASTPGWSPFPPLSPQAKKSATLDRPSQHRFHFMHCSPRIPGLLQRESREPRLYGVGQREPLWRKYPGGTRRLTDSASRDGMCEHARSLCHPRARFSTAPDARLGSTRRLSSTLRSLVGAEPCLWVHIAKQRGDLTERRLDRRPFPPNQSNGAVSRWCGERPNMKSCPSCFCVHGERRDQC